MTPDQFVQWILLNMCRVPGGNVLKVIAWIHVHTAEVLSWLQHMSPDMVFHKITLIVS